MAGWGGAGRGGRMAGWQGGAGRGGMAGWQGGRVAKEEGQLWGCTEPWPLATARHRQIEPTPHQPTFCLWIDLQEVVLGDISLEHSVLQRPAPQRAQQAQQAQQGGAEVKQAQQAQPSARARAGCRRGLACRLAGGRSGGRAHCLIQDLRAGSIGTLVSLPSVRSKSKNGCSTRETCRAMQARGIVFVSSKYLLGFCLLAQFRLARYSSMLHRRRAAPT